MAAAFSALLASTTLVAAASAISPVLGGYDVVNYFTDSAPAMGSAEFAYNFTTDDCNTGAANGGCVPRFTSEFWFTSTAHRDQFKADPWRYAPRWGGF